MNSQVCLEFQVCQATFFEDPWSPRELNRISMIQLSHALSWELVTCLSIASKECPKILSNLCPCSLRMGLGTWRPRKISHLDVSSLPVPQAGEQQLFLPHSKATTWDHPEGYPWTSVSKLLKNAIWKRKAASAVLAERGTLLH